MLYGQYKSTAPSLDANSVSYLQLDQGGNLKTIQSPIAAASYTDRSTIITGGAAQTFMAVNASRRSWRCENISAGDLWINDKGATAVGSQPSFKAAAGNSITLRQMEVY